MAVPAFNRGGGCSAEAACRARRSPTPAPSRSAPRLSPGATGRVCRFVGPCRQVPGPPLFVGAPGGDVESRQCRVGVERDRPRSPESNARCSAKSEIFPPYFVGDQWGRKFPAPCFGNSVVFSQSSTAWRYSVSLRLPGGELLRLGSVVR
jgi:hypothetical protein